MLIVSKPNAYDDAYTDVPKMIKVDLHRVENILEQEKMLITKMLVISIFFIFHKVFRNLEKFFKR